MSPKKSILKELSRQYELAGPGTLVRPSAIPGFQQQPDKYQRAVNQLLQDRLIEGTRDQEGRMALSVNSVRIADVKKEIRPVWAHPAVLALLVMAAAALGVGFAF